MYHFNVAIDIGVSERQNHASFQASSSPQLRLTHPVGLCQHSLSDSYASVLFRLSAYLSTHQVLHSAHSSRLLVPRVDPQPSYMGIFAILMILDDFDLNQEGS